MTSGRASGAFPGREGRDPAPSRIQAPTVRTLTAASWPCWNEGAEPRWPPAVSPAWAGRAPRGAGSRMGGRLCPRDPSCTVLCAQPCRSRLAALSLSLAKLGCPMREARGKGSAAPVLPAGSSAGAGTVRRDRAHVSLPRGPGWLVMAEKQPGRWQRWGGQSSPCPRGSGKLASPLVWSWASLCRALPAPWTPVPAGTHHCTAPATLGAFCIERDFAEFSALLLGPRSPGQGFLGLSPRAGAQAEPGCGAASLRSN